MPGFTTYLQNKVLDHVRGKTAYTMPAVWVALFTAAPTDAGGGTETVYTNYTRAATVGADWTASTGINGTNANAINFPACGATGATIVAFALMDAVTAGNMLAWGTCSLTVSNAVTPSFAIGQLNITLD